MHFDINAMYAYIMKTYKLPYDDFTFLNDEEMRDFNIWDYDENSEYGYILNIDISEIDIAYHDYYNDLPIFPAKRKVYEKEISDYQKHILNVNDKPFMCSEKLTLDYHAEKEYTIHYLTLQCYLRLGGFKITNINYIIKFKQANFMRDYIELNHKNRCESNDENNIRLFTLMSNSLFGRCLLNKDKFNSSVCISSDIDKAVKTVSKDSFKDYDIINENSGLFNYERKCIKLDSPCYIGTTILDLSKILIYENWYKLKNKYKKISVCFISILTALFVISKLMMCMMICIK